jgi:anti-sigma-K factor RskA
MNQEDREQIGEYVLGLLDGAENAAFERRLAADPELADAMERLQRQMHALDDTAGVAEGSHELWQRISAQLDRRSGSATSGRPQLRAANRNSWTRPLGVAASLLVALGIGYAAGTTINRAPQPLVVAVLLTEDGAQPGAIVEAYADDSIRLVPLELAQRPQDRTYQVWTLPDPETGPVSMGIFDDPATIRLAGPNLPLPENGQLYEITLEPAGGSPTGRPTGPILVKGFAKAPL